MKQRSDINLRCVIAHACLNDKYLEDEMSHCLTNWHTVFVYVTDGIHSWSLETKTCLTLNYEENVEFMVTVYTEICDPHVVQMKVQATVSSEYHCTWVCVSER